MLKENSKDVIKIGNDILDRSYINKNNESKAKGMAIESDTKTENAKWLVIDDFNKECNEYFQEIFYNVDIENKELIKPLMEEYNSKVKNLLLDIQANHRFRLQCRDISYDEVAVWTDLLKVLV